MAVIQVCVVLNAQRKSPRARQPREPQAEQRHAAQRSEQLPELAAELVRLNVRAIVVYGPPAILAAKNATSTIPSIFTVSADPVGAGYVASLARPGGNITGLSDFHGGTVTKRLELVKEVAPAASRIAVLLNPGTPTALLQLKSIQAAAPALGVTAFSVEVRGPRDIDRAFVTMGREGSDGLIIVPDPSWFLGHQKRIAQLALNSRLPAISTVREWADAGGLMSYGTNFHDSWRRAATYVDKILKGARPADLPVEQPTKFELTINLKTAKALGLTIPPSLLLRADHVID
jgi:ABC-type uncharacterized transport system substrate-binding protein